MRRSHRLPRPSFRGSISVTLFQAELMVLLVIVLFLQSVRAILVPVTTVPLTIVGAFAGKALTGFAIDTLTMFNGEDQEESAAPHGGEARDLDEVNNRQGGARGDKESSIGLFQI